MIAGIPIFALALDAGLVLLGAVYGTRSQVVAAVVASALSFLIAREAGVPVWRRMPGDASDLAVLAGLLVWWTVHAVRGAA